MAASIEPQRLISVSLGKIAQSRGQRGGINLHKNLLVATVLHRARTAYFESYSFQQQNLHRQKLQSEYSQQSQIVVQVAPNPAPIQVCSSEQSRHEEVCQSSGDSNLGQPTATPTGDESRAAVVPVSASEYEAHDSEDLSSTQEMVCEVTQDKENSPPVISSENLDTELTRTHSPDDHLSAATQLAHEAQVAADNLTISMKQTLTSASTTCNVLKRRRDNPSAFTQENECPASKKARVSYESNVSPIYPGYHSDDSDSDSESEMVISDSPQISNLVSIFNSGFSGLCAVSSDSESDSSGYSNDLNISNSTHFTPLSKVRPESPSPAYSRPEPLMCSTQVGRLESLPSAIILSA